MAALISTVFDQYSSFGLSCTLKDSGGSAVALSAISSISYSLTDAAGEIINSRENIALGVANPVMVSIEPEDTGVVSPTREFNLYLSVTWVYTDSNLGAGSVACPEYKLRIAAKITPMAT